MFKKFVRKRLEKYTRKYFRKYEPTLVVVVGSVGKTTTKAAIATVLRACDKTVRVSNKNYNAEMSVPLALLGVEYPEDSVRSIKAWFKVFKEMKKRIKEDDVPDVIVQELGTDHPGEIPHFGEYLHADVAVVTAISPEHMEYFKTLDNVAREELSVADFADTTIVNEEDIPADYLENRFVMYGYDKYSDFRFIETKRTPLAGYEGELSSKDFGRLMVKIPALSEPALKAMLAATAVATKLGIHIKTLEPALSEIPSVPGRMQCLDGKNETILIDDTYNASPLAVKAALDMLYEIDSPQRIAVLGSMNELGDTSADAHKEVGEYCDPEKLDLVITIGEEARIHLAPAAKKNGCNIKTFRHPKHAGEYVEEKAKKGAVILFKGSQNGVYAEEALKVMLKNPEDSKKLVRQDKFWMKKKHECFKKDKAEKKKEEKKKD